MYRMTTIFRRPLVAAGAACALLAPLSAGAGDICEQVIEGQPSAQDLSGIHPLRRKILETAASQIGKVKDGRGEDGNKIGWRTLLDFYQTAYEKRDKWPPPNLLEQIKKVGRPFPGGAKNPKNVQPYSWCGIFAMWAVRTAGRMDAKWEYGPKGLGKAVFGSKGMQSGDIVVFKGGLVHHALVEKIDGKDIYTIDGNLTCQQVARRKRPFSEVAYYYSTVAPDAPVPAESSAAEKAPEPASAVAEPAAEEAPRPAAEPPARARAKTAAPARPKRAGRAAAPPAGRRLAALLRELRHIGAYVRGLGARRPALRRAAAVCGGAKQGDRSAARRTLRCYVTALQKARKRVLAAGNKAPKLRRVLRRAHRLLEQMK